MEKQEILDCKVTLIGDSGVGKSSIIARYISGIFMNDIMSTSGATYSKKIYVKNGKKVRLNIWDTAGQEKYRALGKNFYKDSYIICIVFDITQKDSFTNIKEIWYPDIQKYGEKYHIISIIGNKCDKFKEEQISEDEANSFAKEIGGKLFFVSAFNGNGIEAMFKTLADNYLNPEFKNKINKNNKERANSFELRKEDFKIKNKKDKCC